MAIVAFAKGTSLGPGALAYVPAVLLIVAVASVGIIAYSKRGLKEAYALLQAIREESKFGVVAYVQADARRAFRMFDGRGAAIRRYAVICAEPTGLSLWVSDHHRAERRVMIPASCVSDVMVDRDPFALVSTMTLYVQTSAPNTRFSLGILDESKPRSGAFLTGRVPLEEVRYGIIRALGGIDIR